MLGLHPGAADADVAERMRNMLREKTVPGQLVIVPITFREACAFVQKLHRHNKPPRGHKFSIGLCVSGELAGVAMIGRPIARHFDDGLTVEINRTCTNGSKNANSMLYGAAWRAAKAMGYRRCITYTQADESGISLRAAGFQKVKELPARASWADSSVKLKGIRDEIGNGGVARVLWHITSGKPPYLPTQDSERESRWKPIGKHGG